MTKLELKPCPFCGGTVFLRVLPDGDWDVAHHRWSLCGARVRVGAQASARRAAGAWNRRVPRESMLARVERALWQGGNAYLTGKDRACPYTDRRCRGAWLEGYDMRAADAEAAE